MDRIRVCADKSIRRWFGYGLLATAILMIAMATDIRLAVRDGALMLVLMWTFLCLKALRAPTADYRKTETWKLLNHKVDSSVPMNRIQDAVGRTLRDRYLWHADVSAVLALLLWGISFGLAAA